MARSLPSQRLPDLIVAAAVAAIVLILALRNGTYDLVDRQATGTLLWIGIGIAGLIGVAPGVRPRLPGALAIASLFGMAIWAAVTLSWSQSDERTVAEVSRTLVHLGFLVLAAVVLPKERWRAAVAGAVLAASAVCALALAHRLAPELMNAEDPAGGLAGVMRLSWPLAYWNAVGAWAAMTATLLLAVSVHVRSPAVRGVALGAIPVTALVTYLSFSRASVAGLVVGLIVVVLVSRHRWAALVSAVVAGGLSAALILTLRGQSELNDGTGTDGRATVLLVIAAGLVVGLGASYTFRALKLDDRRLADRIARPAAVAAVLAVLGGGAAAAATVLPTAIDQFNDTSNLSPTDPAARLASLQGTRSIMWRTAWEAGKTEPFRGTGAGTFEYTWNIRGENPEFVRDAHNIWLEALTEQGIPGLLLLASFAVTLLASIGIARRQADDAEAAGIIAGIAGAAVVYGLSASVDWMWETTAITAFFLILAGSAIASTGIARAPTWPPRTVLVVAALIAAMWQLPGLTGTSEVRKSERAAATGDLASARVHADQAIDIEPWAAGPFVQRALVDERAGRYDAAAVALRFAADRDPKDWRVPLIQARISAKAGNPTDALNAYRRARALRPQGEFFR